MEIEKLTVGDVNARLRSLRQARGWSLIDVEARSQGRLKAVVLGSYERGTRAITIKRALQIAELYGVPITQIFSDKKTTQSEVQGRKMFDLRTISDRAQRVGPSQERFIAVARFTRAILESRQDWNGEVLSIRNEDCKVLALILDIEIEELLQWFDDEKVLLAIR